MGNGALLAKLGHSGKRFVPELQVRSAWNTHLPFAAYLIERIRPTTFVELGTYCGISYCGFLQAITELNLSTRCWAVDTWEGDPHAGQYGPDILAELRRHHDPRFSQFSKLLQMRFDQARDSFADGSIDLLHIDGLHTYEAVREDYETWLPKMSPRGVMLFHDSNVRDDESFGVWKLWEEISHKYPSFEFLHGYGLGVLAVGPEMPETLAPLMSLSPAEIEATRNYFHQMGRRCCRPSPLNRLSKSIGASWNRLFAKAG